MTRDFRNVLRKGFYTVRTDPILLLCFVGFAAVMAACFIVWAYGLYRPDGAAFWAILAAASVLTGVAVLASLTCVLWLVCDRWLKLDIFTETVTPNFRVLRLWRVGYIHQCRRKDIEGCGALFRDVVSEKRRLLPALPPGRYRALSHDTVKMRLENAGNVSGLRCVPAYKDSLTGIRDRMLGCGRCNKKGNCSFHRLSPWEKQFYYIEFTKL